MSAPTLDEWLASHRPLNWNEYGSSAKDLHDERMTRSYYKLYPKED